MIEGAGELRVGGGAVAGGWWLVAGGWGGGGGGGGGGVEWDEGCKGDLWGGGLVRYGFKVGRGRVRVCAL